MSTTTPSARTIAGAIKALDGFAEVAKNEMIVHGVYLDEQVSRPDLAKAGAVCGGRRACAVGSLYLGAGVPLKRTPYSYSEGFSLDLPGVNVYDRPEFLKRRPMLRLAYETLNTVAAELWPKQLTSSASEDEWGDPVPTVADPQAGNGAMEQLFESGKLRARGRPRADERASQAEHQKLLDLIAAARERLVAA